MAPLMLFCQLLKKCCSNLNETFKVDCKNDSTHSCRKPHGERKQEKKKEKKRKNEKKKKRKRKGNKKKRKE